VIALLDLEPFSCPCGCGQFLAIGPCFEQADQLVKRNDVQLTEIEKQYLREGNKITAIKLLRDRTVFGLREAVDIVDKFIDQNKTLDNPF
jgi:ribosomal protein L7/L12